MTNKNSPGLFSDLPEQAQLQSKSPKAHHHDPNAPARVLTPNRLQTELHPSNLESLLAEGHQARLVWSYVEQQNLKGMYDPIKAREGGAGRGAIAPEILFSLWLYATIDHVGSARELARLTTSHDYPPDEWLVDGGYFRLRPLLASSPSCPAESSSLYYGLPIRFRLLSTPLHSDAVTFSYGVLAYSDTDLHRAVCAPSRAH